MCNKNFTSTYSFRWATFLLHFQNYEINDLFLCYCDSLEYVAIKDASDVSCSSTYKLTSTQGFSLSPSWTVKVIVTSASSSTPSSSSIYFKDTNSSFHLLKTMSLGQSKFKISHCTFITKFPTVSVSTRSFMITL